MTALTALYGNDDCVNAINDGNAAMLCTGLCGNLTTTALNTCPDVGYDIIILIYLYTYSLYMYISYLYISTLLLCVNVCNCSMLMYVCVFSF